jgi:hypothetical protein
MGPPQACWFISRFLRNLDKNSIWVASGRETCVTTEQPEMERGGGSSRNYLARTFTSVPPCPPRLQLRAPLPSAAGQPAASHACALPFFALAPHARGRPRGLSLPLSSPGCASAPLLAASYAACFGQVSVPRVRGTHVMLTMPTRDANDGSLGHLRAPATITQNYLNDLGASRRLSSFLC